MLESKFCCTGSTKSKAVVKRTSGCAAFSSSSLRCTPAATSVSLAPRVRLTSKATTGLPSSSAALRGSATVSSTRATSPSRTRRPSGSGRSSRARSSADSTLAEARTDCSAPPSCARPPAASCCTSRSWRDTPTAVTPRPSRRCGSSSTRTSRLTPPTRVTPPTPGTPRSARATVSSTNQDRLSASMPVDATVKVSIGIAARSTLETIGSRSSAGRSLRMRDTASRTSSTASCRFFSSRNSAVTTAPPSTTVAPVFLMPCTAATAVSTLRATSVSICAGAAPGIASVTVTSGNSTSGMFCTFIARKPSSPAIVSSTNSSTDGIGWRIDQAETFTWPLPPRAPCRLRPGRPRRWPPRPHRAPARR